MALVFVRSRSSAPQSRSALQQDLLVFLGYQPVELALLAGDLGQQLRRLALKIRLDAADSAAAAPPKAARRVQTGVVVDLNEGLERHAEPLAVIEQCAMMIGDPPRAGVDIVPLLELAVLGLAAKFGEAVATAGSSSCGHRRGH